MRRAVVLLALSALVLSGCSGRASGQAATSDRFAISQADVAEQVEELAVVSGQPPGDPAPGQALINTQRMVQDQLVGLLAADLGLSVTDTDVERGVVNLAQSLGGAAALTSSAVKAGIPPTAIPDTVRTNLLVRLIGAQLAPGAGDADAVGATRSALGDFSASINVEVAPRYGTWRDEDLAIAPGSQVASPAPAPAPIAAVG